MRPHKTDGEEKRPLRVLRNEFASLGGCFAIGMNHFITVSGDDDEGVAAHDGLYAIRVVLQCLADAGRLPLRALAVEAFGP